MIKNNLSFEEEISIMIHYDISPNELFILRLLMLAKDGDTSLIKRYITNVPSGKKILIDCLDTLKNKKIISSSFNLPEEGETLSLTTVPINKNFIKTFIRETNQIGKEFFDAYPPFIYINGKMTPIRNFAKAGLYTFDEFCLFYAKTIKDSAVTHERILEDLQFAKENNLISFSILEFLASHKWEEIEYIRNSGEINGYNNTELI
jgi:hypothetical protein